MNAPYFSLSDQFGKKHELSQYKGKWIVLYFYPKDDTPGCTKEACGFRDLAAIYKKEGIVVLGVSKDSPISHKKFADKYRLPFTLLSDESKETIKAYGAWGKKKFLGKTFEGVLRKTFLIDPQGNIRKQYDKVDVLHHAEKIVDEIKALS